MAYIGIGASRQRLQNIAQELLNASASTSVDVTIYAINNMDGTEVELNISNSDMEDRIDIDINAVVVEIEN